MIARTKNLKIGFVMQEKFKISSKKKLWHPSSPGVGDPHDDSDLELGMLLVSFDTVSS